MTKTPLPNPRLLPNQPKILYNVKEHGRHTLFCGTQVIQTRYYGKQKVKAVVLRTGKVGIIRTGVQMLFLFMAGTKARVKVFKTNNFFQLYFMNE